MNPSSPPALVLGEALIDAVVDAAGSRLTPGGSPMNVAVGLARLGVPVTLATQFGDDEYGRLIAAHLAKDHVTVDRADGRTSVARAELNADGSARYDFDIEWDRGAPVTATVPAVAHTGSIGAFLQPGNRAAADLFRQLPRRRSAASTRTYGRPCSIGRQRSSSSTSSSVARTSSSSVTKTPSGSIPASTRTASSIASSTPESGSLRSRGARPGRSSPVPPAGWRCRHQPWMWPTPSERETRTCRACSSRCCGATVSAGYGTQQWMRPRWPEWARSLPRRRRWP